MTSTETEFVLSDTQQLLESGTDEFGRTVYYVIDKSPEKVGHDAAAPSQDLRNQQNTCGSSLVPSSQSLPVDSVGNFYPYTEPMTTMENFQASLVIDQQNASNDKVRVEMVNPAVTLSPSSFTQNCISQGMSTDVLNNSTAGDLILSAENQTVHDNSSTIQVQNFQSPGGNFVTTLPFNTPPLSNSQTITVPNNIDSTQILNSFNAETLETLRTIFDIEEETPVNVTTTENAVNTDPATTVVPSSVSDLQQLQQRFRVENTMVLMKPGALKLDEAVTLSKRKESKSNKSERLTEFPGSSHDMSVVKKIVSSYCPDFSSYPENCACLEPGSEIPVEQIWLHDGQMYYLPQINVLVISLEEYVGFLRQDKWYISVGEITQRLIPNFKKEVESYLVKRVCDKQFLSLEEIEYLKQRKCISPSTKSGTMISLDTLRGMCQYLTSTKSFIEAKTNGLVNAATGEIYKKVFEKHTRCSKCGGSVKKLDILDKYVIIDAPTCTLEPSVSHSIPKSNPSGSSSATEMSILMGTVAVGDVVFQSFRLEDSQDSTYISLKELVERQVFSLQLLQTRLVHLQYRPRPAPAAVDLYFTNENLDVYQTLWIDLMTVRCACAMTRQRSPNTKIEQLQHRFTRGQYTCTFTTEITACEDTDTSTMDTVYTLDPNTYKITTKNNQPSQNEVDHRCSQAANEHIKTNRAANQSKTPRQRQKSGGNKASGEKLEKSGKGVQALKPGLYYFSDKNSIVDFLKTTSIEKDNETSNLESECDTARSVIDIDKEFTKQPVKFRVLSAARPNKSQHVLATDTIKVTRKKTESKHKKGRKKNTRRKLKELDVAKEDIMTTVPKVRHRRQLSNGKETDVSSSVPGYQDMVDQLSTSNSASSPEVQNKNVDSTATNNAEEPETSHSEVNPDPNSTAENLVAESAKMQNQDSVDMEQTVPDSNSVQEESDYFGGDDIDDGDADDTYGSTESIKSPTISKSDFSPSKIAHMECIQSSTPIVLTRKQRNVNQTSTQSVNIATEESKDNASDTSHVENKMFEHLKKKGTGKKNRPFPKIQLSPLKSKKTARKRSKSKSGGAESTKVPNKKRKISSFSKPVISGHEDSQEVSCSSLDVTNTTESQTSMISSSVVTSPCSSPLSDQKRGKNDASRKIDRLCSKCTCSSLDESLQLLATVATDLETLQETSSESGLSEKSPLDATDVLNEVATVVEEIDNDEACVVICSKQTMRDKFRWFFEQLFDRVEVGSDGVDSSGARHVHIKLRDDAKETFPALWKEAGQHRLKKLMRLLSIHLLQDEEKKMHPP